MRFFLVGLWLLCVSPVVAQGWSYPSGVRRDPVVPPRELYAPDAFAALRVGSIFYDPSDVRASRVVVHLDAGTPGRWLVGAGDRVGRYRVVEILADRVRVLFDFLGSPRPQTLEPLRQSSAR